VERNFQLTKRYYGRIASLTGGTEKLVKKTERLEDLRKVS